MIEMVTKVVKMFTDILLSPFIYVKYKILWLFYYNTIKGAEEILASKRLIFESIPLGEMIMRNVVASMINDLQAEFDRKPRNYSLFAKIVNNFFDLIEAPDNKDLIRFRVTRKK